MARASILSSSIRYRMTPGSSAPQRVPIASPSAGVKPIVVATLRPASIAHMLAPLPRCSTIVLAAAALASSRGSFEAGDVFVGQAVKAVALHAGIVELRRQRESLGDIWIRSMERRVEARDLGKLRRAFEQAGHRRQVVGLVEGRQRDEALESLDRLGLDQHRRRELQAPVDDPVPYPPEPPTCQVVLQEVPEIFDRPVVTERRSLPRPFGDDASGEVARRETRRDVKALDLPSELHGEVARSRGEDGELDARRAGVQNEDRVIRAAHRCRPPALHRNCHTERGNRRAARPKRPRGQTYIAKHGRRSDTSAKLRLPAAWQAPAD